MEQVFEGVQAFVDGAMFGAIYALIGIGFTLVFGITRRLHLGYASASLAAAYLGVAAGQYLSDYGFLMVSISVAAGAVLGVLVYLTCFRVTLTSHPLGPLVSTFGLLLFASAAMGYATDWEPLLYPDLADMGFLDMGALSIRADLIRGAGGLRRVHRLLYAVLFRTRLGLAIRALAQQPVVAQLCGISVVHMSIATFALTGAVGGLAAGMTGVAVGVLSTAAGDALDDKGADGGGDRRPRQCARRDCRRPAGGRGREYVAVPAGRPGARPLCHGAVVRLSHIPAPGPVRQAAG